MFFESLQIIAAAPATEVAGEGPVQQILREFHVDGWSFAAQLLNFFIVVFLLKKFAYGPVLDILEKRRRRVEEGEEKLAEIEKQLKESEERTQEALAEADAQAKRLVEEAKESASLLSDKKTQEAVASAQAIIAKAEEAARAEREQMQTDLRREFGRLVTTTTAQVTGKVLTDDDQRRLNEEALAKVEG
jgi:F-type H+-transporting ATPase subunit b